jgi:hypothetical protein
LNVRIFARSSCAIAPPCAQSAASHLLPLLQSSLTECSSLRSESGQVSVILRHGWNEILGQSPRWTGSIHRFLPLVAPCSHERPPLRRPYGVQSSNANYCRGLARFPLLPRGRGGRPVTAGTNYVRVGLPVRRLLFHAQEPSSDPGAASGRGQRTPLPQKGNAMRTGGGINSDISLHARTG